MGPRLCIVGTFGDIELTSDGKYWHKDCLMKHVDTEGKQLLPWKLARDVRNYRDKQGWRQQLVAQMAYSKTRLSPLRCMYLRTESRA